jgi:hypothetical protein
MHHRRHADQLLRGSCADEIVSRFAAHIRRPESYSDGPSRGALEVVNTDSEGTGVVFAEDPAVLLDELDQIAIGVADEDRSDAEIERLVSRAYAVAVSFYRKLMRIASEFGFTPASRSRISVPPADQLPLLDLTADDYEEGEPGEEDPVGGGSSISGEPERWGRPRSSLCGRRLPDFGSG